MGKTDTTPPPVRSTVAQAEGNNPQLLVVQYHAGASRRAEHFEGFGLASVPPVNTEAVVLQIAGHQVVVATQDRNRPDDLAEGEVCLYSPGGARVVCRADGSIELAPAAGKNVVVKGNLSVEGYATATGNLSADGKVQAGTDVEAAGNVKDATGSLAGLRNQYGVHIHLSPVGLTDGPQAP